MSKTYTIRARVTEAVKDGVGFPTHVTVTGAGFLQGSAVLDIAQHAVDDQYGEYGTGFLATMDRSDWYQAQKNGTADNYKLTVVHYK